MYLLLFGAYAWSAKVVELKVLFLVFLIALFIILSLWLEFEKLMVRQQRENASIIKAYVHGEFIGSSEAELKSTTQILDNKISEIMQLIDDMSNMPLSRWFFLVVQGR